jgi:carbonic anhydrase
MKIIPLFAALLATATLHAADESAPPKPDNVLDPSAALERLKAGNVRYAAGESDRKPFAASREALAAGQNPYAAILSCADSRVAPELAFDEGRGDLFVVRLAGNFVNPDGLASMEFAVAVLGTPLIVVLGHEGCGAVKAAIGVVTEDAKLPGHLPALVESIRPAVVEAQKESGDLLVNSTRDNVNLNVQKLVESTPILKEAVDAGKLQVVGAVYDLDSGEVEFLAN